MINAGLCLYGDTKTCIVKVETEEGNWHYSWFLDSQESRILRVECYIYDYPSTSYQIYDSIKEYLESIRECQWIWQTVPDRIKEVDTRID